MRERDISPTKRWNASNREFLGILPHCVFQPIGDGPVQNKLGKAIVQMLVSGVETEYAIQAQPLTEESEEEISGFELAASAVAAAVVDKN